MWWMSIVQCMHFTIHTGLHYVQAVGKLHALYVLVEDIYELYYMPNWYYKPIHNRWTSKGIAHWLIVHILRYIVICQRIGHVYNNSLYTPYIPALVFFFFNQTDVPRAKEPGVTR